MASTLGSNPISEVHLPSLRSLDDFIVGSARFQIPNFKDFDKWGNRVIKNLLYYQTNYFLVLIAIYGLMIILNPLKIICGLLVHTFLIIIFLQYFGDKTESKFTKVPKDNRPIRWYILAGSALFGYLALHLLDAFLVSTFTLSLTISIVFIHASLRLRNIKNKVVNTMESLSPSTPMGSLLDALNITGENMLK